VRRRRSRVRTFIAGMLVHVPGKCTELGRLRDHAAAEYMRKRRRERRFETGP
jgi:hypothetical protein